MTRGYRIVTTIDVKAQKAAQAAARRAAKTSPMKGQPKNLMAAMVAMEPKTGRVLAYYGGESGVVTDFAGRNVDGSGNRTGGHPPGSSFKIYTLAAALEAGKSLQSRWKSDPFKPEGVGYTDAQRRNRHRQDQLRQPVHIGHLHRALLQRALLSHHRGDRAIEGHRDGPQRRHHHDVEHREQPGQGLRPQRRQDGDPRRGLRRPHRLRPVPGHGARPRQRRRHLRQPRQVHQGALSDDHRADGPEHR